MKRFILITLYLSTILFGQKEFGKISLPLGRVQVQKAGKGDFKRAMPKMSVHENDIIKRINMIKLNIEFFIFLKNSF